MQISTALEGWILDLRAENKSPKTIIWYEHKVRHFVNWVTANGISSVAALEARHLREFLRYLAALNESISGGRSLKKGAPSSLTVRGYAQVLRTFGRWLTQCQYVERDPFDGVRMPKVDQYVIAAFTPDDMRRMLESTKRSRNAVRDYAIILLMYDTAIRAGELISLSLDRIDFQAGWLRVLGKGSKERMVPMGRTSRRALWRYVHDARPEPLTPRIENAFLSERGQPMTHAAVWAAVKNAATWAGIKGKRLSPHTIRHAAAEEFLRNGGDAFALQRLLGHTTLTVTRMYVDLVERDLEEAHRRASPGDNLSSQRRTAGGTRLAID